MGTTRPELGHSGNQRGDPKGSPLFVPREGFEPPRCCLKATCYPFREGRLVRFEPPGLGINAKHPCGPRWVMLRAPVRDAAGNERISNSCAPDLHRVSTTVEYPRCNFK
jgi:hypothetical protein